MASMSMSVRIRLSIMMFLQFMLFAVWSVPLAAYLNTLGLSGFERSLALSSMAIGCLASPIIGMIADRYFASQKVLAVLNLLGAGFLFAAAYMTSPVSVTVLLVLQQLCYMPTWGLTSAIAMSHSPSDKFPQIRVFGTVGWVASGLFSLAALSIWGAKIDGTYIPLLCGAGTSLVAALLALALPDTPPPAKGKKASIVDALGLRSFALLKDPSFAVFMAISLLVMIPFSLYWWYGSAFLKDKGFEFITITMNWGQAVEMFFILLVPVALAKLGIKWTMVIGLVALVARYAFFLAGGACDQSWMYFGAILVHGAIFGFFFVGGQVYVDKKAPPELRAQAQGLIFLMTFGLGLLVGTFINGALIEAYTTTVGVGAEATKVYEWGPIWTITTISCVVLLAAFLVFFRPKVAEQAAAAQGGA